MVSRRRKLRVVLWAEEPVRKGGTQKLKVRANVLLNLLQRHLRWLTPHVLVTNCQIGHGLPNVSVTYVV
jgi:hypothetical protein